MSSEFKWTPDQVRRLTLQELEHYIVQYRRHRDNVPPHDRTLELIRRALFGFFGIKEGDDVEKATSAAPHVPRAELEAWYAAGMPSPPPWKKGR